MSGKGTSYLGTELYVTAYSATKPTAADKINKWRSLTGIFSIQKELIEIEFVDGDGYSDFTSGIRRQDDTVVDVHKIDVDAIKRLDELALADPANERCKVWIKPAPLIGVENTDKYWSEAIIYKRTEREANKSNSQGVTYVFKPCGKINTWDGVVG